MAEPERCPYQDLGQAEILALAGEELHRIRALCWQCVGRQRCWVGREVLASWLVTRAFARRLSR